MFLLFSYVLLAADASVARSIVVFKQDEDKIVFVDKTKAVALAGPQADTEVFSQYIAKNLALYRLNNHLTLDTHGTANYVRQELATALRKGPFQVDLLLGGADPATSTVSLYRMDYLAALSKVNYSACGYCAFFLMSLLDHAWKEGMDEEAGLALVKECMKEIQTRFLMQQKNFTVKFIYNSGENKVLTLSL